MHNKLEAFRGTLETTRHIRKHNQQQMDDVTRLFWGPTFEQKLKMTIRSFETKIELSCRSIKYLFGHFII